MYLTCVYNYKLYWFYGNHVRIFIALFFLSFPNVLVDFRLYGRHLENSI